MIHAVIISFNTKDMTKDCILSLNEHLSFTSFQITLVDNGSDDGTAEYIKEEFPLVKVIALDVNKGFAGACNIGFRNLPDADYTFFVNTDTRPLEGSLKKIFTSFEEDSEAGVISGMLLNEDLSDQNTYSAYPDLLSGLFGRSILEYLLPGKYPSKKFKVTSNNSFSVDCVVGAFFCVRTTLLKKLGGFDERFFFFLEETDLCRRINDAGYKIKIIPDAGIIHFQGGSANKAPLWSRYNYHRSLYQYFFKWYGLLPSTLLYTKNIIKHLINTVFYTLISMITFRKKINNKLKVSVLLLKAHFKGFPYYCPGSQQVDFLAAANIINISRQKEKLIRLSDFQAAENKNRQIESADFDSKLKEYLMFLSSLGVFLKKDLAENLYFNKGRDFFINESYPLQINLIKSACLNRKAIRQLINR